MEVADWFVMVQCLVLTMGGSTKQLETFLRTCMCMYHTCMCMYHTCMYMYHTCMYMYHHMHAYSGVSLVVHIHVLSSINCSVLKYQRWKVEGG